MSPFVGQMYQKQVNNYYDNYSEDQLKKYFRQGTFVHSSMYGSYEKTCFITFESEADDIFDIRFFDENLCQFVNRRVPRDDVKMPERELEYFVVKNIKNGSYHKASASSSKCPSIYSSKGKAESRRKQMGRPNDWVVKRWEIKESDV